MIRSDAMAGGAPPCVALDKIETMSMENNLSLLCGIIVLALIESTP
jgi:hypothetical protein